MPSIEFPSWQEFFFFSTNYHIRLRARLPGKIIWKKVFIAVRPIYKFTAPSGLAHDFHYYEKWKYVPSTYIVCCMNRGAATGMDPALLSTFTSTSCLNATSYCWNSAIYILLTYIRGVQMCISSLVNYSLRPMTLLFREKSQKSTPWSFIFSSPRQQSKWQLGSEESKQVPVPLFMWKSAYS